MTSARFYPSLTKPIMISGIERKPAGVAIGCGLGMLALAWQLFSIVCLLVGVLLLTGGLYVLRDIAKRDPMMFEVYRRFVFYPRFLPARSTPFRIGR
jgi:type IV secretory pathway TrbD component